MGKITLPEPMRKMSATMTIRLPVINILQIKERAQTENTSVNAWIKARLVEGLNRDGGHHDEKK